MSNLLHDNLNNIRAKFRSDAIDPRDVATAVHEAAHAVVAMSLGFRVTELYADFRNPDAGGYEGACRWNGDGANDVETALIAAAGWRSLQFLESGIRYTAGSFHSVERPTGGDLDDLRAALGADYDGYLDKIRKSVDEILQEHRVVMDGLASALLIKPRLSEADIRAVAGRNLADRWQTRSDARVSTSTLRSSAPAASPGRRPSSRGTGRTMRDVVPGLRYSDIAPMTPVRVKR